MHPNLKIRWQKAGPRLVEQLQKRHFDAYYCDSKEEALEKALSLIPKEDVVSWGGCQSAIDIGLLDAVRARNKVIDRDTASTMEERLELQRQGLMADTFIAGTNAVSEDGQLVNIDGNGNRVAAMTYGPRNVIVLCGMNKMAKTVEDAMTRARTVSAPINVQKFENNKTPCVVTGECGNCKSEDCICCYLSIIRVCRPAGKIKVIVVGEELGF